MATTKITPIQNPSTNELELFAERDIIAVEDNRETDPAFGINNVAGFSARRDSALYFEHYTNPGDGYFMHNTGMIALAVIHLVYHPPTTPGSHWPNVAGTYTIHPDSSVNETRYGDDNSIALVSTLGIGNIRIIFSLKPGLLLGFQCLCQPDGMNINAPGQDWNSRLVAVNNRCSNTFLSRTRIDILKWSVGFGGVPSKAYDGDTSFAIFGSKAP